MHKFLLIYTIPVGLIIPRTWALGRSAGVWLRPSMRRSGGVRAGVASPRLRPRPSATHQLRPRSLLWPGRSPRESAAMLCIGFARRSHVCSTPANSSCVASRASVVPQAPATQRVARRKRGAGFAERSSAAEAKLHAANPAQGKNHTPL